MKKKCNLTLMFFLLLVGGKSYAQGSYALSVGDKITNQMTVTSVPNITMTFGGSDTYSADLWVDPISDPQVPGFTAVTNGNTQNPKDGAGKPYSAASANMPTHGTYYVFQPLYDGTLYLAVKCNSGKNFFITEDGVPMAKYNGITYGVQYCGMDTVEVKSGKTYYMFCIGSKLGFYGFSYESFGSNPIAALQNKLSKKIGEVRGMENAENVRGVAILVQMLDEAALKYEDMLSSEDSLALASSIDSLAAVVSHVNRICSEISVLQSLISSYTDLFLNTSYPGYAAFEAVNTRVSNLDYTSETLTEEDILKATQELKNAHQTYIFSQEKNADGYIDVSDFLQSPSFHAPGELTSYTSAGWIMSKVTTTSDCSARSQSGKACYNSWSDNFVSMNLYQNVSGLPNGYYAIKCSGTTGPNDVNDQHAYITTTLGTAVSPVLAGCDLGNNVWIDQASPRIYTNNGAMTVGYASTSGGGVKGWFCVTDFQLRYYGDADDAGILKLYNDGIDSAATYATSMHVKGDALKYQKAILAAKGMQDRVSQIAAIETLAQSKSVAEASEAKYNSVTAYGQVMYALANAAVGTYGSADTIMRNAYIKMVNYLASDTSTYTKLDGYAAMLNAYAGSYAKVYNQANNVLSSFTSPTAKKELDDIISAQTATLLTSATLTSVAGINAMSADLFEAIRISMSKNIIETASSDSDFTSFIQNPDAGGFSEDISGWKIDKGTGGNYTSNGEHYSGDKSLHYFDSWNATVGKLNYYGAQTVSNLPNGTYKLTFGCRTSGDKGAFVFAGTEKDTAWFRIPVQTYTLTAGKADGTDSVINVYNTYGQIWQEAQTAVEKGTATPEQTTLANVNNGIGYGWQWQSIDNIVVDNHQLVLGMTTNSAYTNEAFNGNWFSVGDFRLTRTVAGDNTGWNPVTAVTTPVADASIMRIYTMEGVLVNRMSRPGIYIIKRGNEVKKVLFRK